VQSILVLKGMQYSSF